MARNPCGCVGTECSCKIVSTDGSLIVNGKGTAAQPYDLANNSGHFEVVDTPTVNLTKSGDGSAGQPYTISAQATVSTMELEDVDHSIAPQLGQILAWDGAKYTPAPPVTAAPGAIHHDTSLKGDGAAATPLGVLLDPNGLLQGTGNGVGLSQAAIAAINRAVRPIPPPVRVLRPASQNYQDYFASGAWTQILSYVGQGYPAGWYDISGRISVFDGSAPGPMGRGSAGFTRINVASAGASVATTCNNMPFYPANLEGEQTDYWQAVSLAWPIKGTYHHPGGELRFAVDTICTTAGLNVGVQNTGTAVVLSCISLD